MSIIDKIKNKNSEAYGDTIWTHNHEEDKHSQALSWFFTLPPQHILEAGCGTGNYIVSLTHMGHTVTGVELDPERITIAKNYMKRYNIDPERIYLGDLTHLQFPNKHFDAIFSHGVIEHIKNHELALDELARVLKQGGHAMISVPNRFTVFTISKLLLQGIDKLFRTRLWNVGYEKSFTKWTFKKQLEKHFIIKELLITEINPGHTIPLYGKLLRILDKPLYWLGIGGHWLYAWVQKPIPDDTQK